MTKVEVRSERTSDGCVAEEVAGDATGRCVSLPRFANSSADDFSSAATAEECGQREQTKQGLLSEPPLALHRSGRVTPAEIERDEGTELANARRFDPSSRAQYYAPNMRYLLGRCTRP